MPTKRSITVYGLLAAVWIFVCVWQVFEHSRIKDSAREALLNRAVDISNSVGVVVRSRSPFGFVLQPRLEAALKELTKSKELRSVAVLNSANEIVAIAGEGIDQEIEDLVEKGEVWTKDAVTIVNLVELGRVMQDEGSPRSSPIIVSPPRSINSPGAGGMPSGSTLPMPPMPDRPFGGEKTGASGAMVSDEPLDDEKIDTLLSMIPRDLLGNEERKALRSLMSGEPLDDEKIGILRDIYREESKLGAVGPPPGLTREPMDNKKQEALQSLMSGEPLDDEKMGILRDIFRDRLRLGPIGPPPFRRPPWMHEGQYQELAKKQGVHAFVLSLSTDTFRAESVRDYWLRIALSTIALIAALGLGVGWHNLERSSNLQIRLLRASEMNSYLREMNIAAAGLAHETRNPLNLIRGIAQMISKHEEASAEIRMRSSEITDEVDRVTGRLNQFIEYSRPPETRPAPTDLKAVISEVARALETDREDRAIQFSVTGPDLTVRADESLLRQVIFNLLLNSIQAVDHGGSIEVLLEKDGPHEASFLVRDDGPGVPENAKEEIFRPYYSTSEQGTGLGLAVVRQIVLAHQWEIAYILSDGRGATFRVSGLHVIQKVVP